MTDYPQIDFQPGHTFRAQVPMSVDVRGCKIHIVSIIDEQDLKVYVGPRIVYRVFGKRKRWWNYFIDSKASLEFYIYQQKRFDLENGIKK